MFDLVGLRFATRWLKVDDFHHTVPAKNKMAAFDPFLKSELRQDMPQIAKIYIPIGRPTEDCPQCVFKFAHGKL